MLFRLLILLFTFSLSLYACKGGYNACVQKTKASHAVLKNSLSIPLKNNKRLLFTHQKPNAKILKYDPFLSLYIVEDRSPFAYPFDVNMRIQLGTAMVTAKGSCEGKFVANQIGLNSFARYSEPLIAPALLLSSCCWLEGIVTSRGIIQKEYLQRFIESKTTEYSDIGIRVRDKKGKLIVTACDPFFSENPFEKGDRILYYDSKRVTSASSLMQKILFAPLHSKHRVLIRRGSKKLSLFVKTQKRYGGGYISDTFLESKGLYFNKNLALTKILKEFQKYGLHLGDRLIQVNGVLVSNQNELRAYISKYKDYSSLLFERDGFEFFVNIK